MKKVGMYMAFLGLLAIVFNFMGRVPSVLAWIYNWGDATAWAIKIGMVVIGGVLFFIGSKKESEEASIEEEK